MSTQESSRIWFITGCSSGLGRALAGRVLARGQRVVATAREPGQLDEFVGAHPATCRALALDVTDDASVKDAIREAESAFGRLDVVVNNAGRGLIGALEEVSQEEIARNFDVNFFGTLRVIRAALPSLRAQRSGHIVNVSAAAAISNYAGFSIYGAAKCALEGVSEALGAEMAPFGIRITIVQPGPLRTDFIGRSLERAARRVDEYDGTSGKFARLLESMNGRQTGDPEKAADAIIAAVESDAPPLRLVLGKYAHDKLRKRIKASERELAEWESVGFPIEFTSKP
jgi:NAD(P)-dependent dehydrogenase (short-subunit alcohol dehydrogenase family)